MNYPFDFYTAHSELQDKPRSLASAATIAPVGSFTVLTGTTPVVTITPPSSAYHELTLMFTSAFANALNTGGNIAVAWTSVANRPIKVHYNPLTGLYYPATVA